MRQFLDKTYLGEGLTKAILACGLGEAPPLLGEFDGLLRCLMGGVLGVAEELDVEEQQTMPCP